jgi:uncharacterized protein YjbJ (UPF0337 family)
MQISPYLESHFDDAAYLTVGAVGAIHFNGSCKAINDPDQSDAAISLRRRSPHCRRKSYSKIGPVLIHSSIVTRHTAKRVFCSQPQPSRSIMNRNQAKGSIKDVAGKIQRKVGEITGSSRQQIKGTAKQVEGKVQKGIGNAQQAVDDADRRERQQDR